VWLAFALFGAKYALIVREAAHLIQYSPR
jgi:hypothetical protein